MDRKNTVSVIIATRNSDSTIEGAINSLLNQSYKLHEIIIVDDYSVDSTAEIISKINDSRIVFHEKKDEPRYLAASRNIGVNLSSGEFITFLDADDVSLPSRIEVQVNKILETNADICGTNITYKFPDRSYNSDFPINHSEIIAGFTRIRNRATIVGATMMIRRKHLIAFKYKEYLRFSQDWDLFLRLYENGFTFVNTNESLYVYNRHDSNSRVNSDWDWYNILIRYNQDCRRLGKTEVESLDYIKRKFLLIILINPIYVFFYVHLKIKRYFK